VSRGSGVRSVRSAENVFVAYRDHMVLRIPLAATNLVPAQAKVTTKLTLQALTELKTLVEQCEVLCPMIRKPSGSGLALNNDGKSPKSSAPSCRR
jgi:hypothetical protein